MAKRIIWKYRLARTSELQRINMPAKARPLSVGVQHDPERHQDELTIWMQFEEGLERTPNPHRFQVAMTGKAYKECRPENLVGAVVMGFGGSEVYHVFDLGEG